MIGLSVAVSTVFLWEMLSGLAARVTVVSLLGGYQSNLWVSIDFAHQYPRNRVGQFHKLLVALGVSGFSTLQIIEYLRIFYTYVYGRCLKII